MGLLAACGCCHAWQVVLGEEIENDLPYNDYYAYYGPDFALHFGTNPTMENANTRQYIDGVKQQVTHSTRPLP